MFPFLSDPVQETHSETQWTQCTNAKFVGLRFFTSLQMCTLQLEALKLKTIWSSSIQVAAGLILFAFFFFQFLGPKT